MSENTSSDSYTRSASCETSKMSVNGLEIASVLTTIESKLAYIPGGRDLEGRPLIVVNVPSELHPTTRTSLESAFEYFLRIFSGETKLRGFALIVDARRGAWRVARTCIRLAAALLGSYAGAVIIVRPEDGFWDKRVDNCTKLSKDGKFNYITLTKISSYVDITELPYELGGSKVYDHAEWIQTRVRVDDFCNDVLQLTSRMTDFEARLQCLDRTGMCPPDESLDTYWEIGTDLTATARRIIHSGKSLASLMRSETSQDVLDTVHRINEYLDNVEIQQMKIERSWLQMEQSFDIAKRLSKLEEGVTQVTNWILGPADAMLNSCYQVGFDVASSEELRREHEELELKCRDTYGRYAELLHKIDSIPSHRLPKDLESQRDFMDFVCRSFASRLERRRNVLITSQRFFRLVSEYFDKTSEVFDKLVMGNRNHDFSQAGAKLQKLEECQTMLESLERELVKEGEKLSDILSMPIKDALGRDVQVDYGEDIVNIRDILDATNARKNIFNDSVKLQKVTLKQIALIDTYENDAEQAVKWLNDLFDVLIEKHVEIGCNTHEMQTQKEEHQSFQETAKGTYDYGCQLINGARVLRMSCRLSLEKNVSVSTRLRHVWKQIRTVGQEQLTRLRICAIFHRNVEDHCLKLHELIDTVESLRRSTDAENLTCESRARMEMRDVLGNRERLLMEVGRMVRLGRLLRTRLKEPIFVQQMADTKDEEAAMTAKQTNLTAVDAISARLAEVTRLAERLDAKLCEAGARTRPVPMSIATLPTVTSSILASTSVSTSTGTSSYVTATVLTPTSRESPVHVSSSSHSALPSSSPTLASSSTILVAPTDIVSTTTTTETITTASTTTQPSTSISSIEPPMDTTDNRDAPGSMTSLSSSLERIIVRDVPYVAHEEMEPISSDFEFPPPPEEVTNSKHIQTAESFERQIGEESAAEDYVTATECSNTPNARSRSESFMTSPEYDNALDILPPYSETPQWSEIETKLVIAKSKGLDDESSPKINDVYEPRTDDTALTDKSISYEKIVEDKSRKYVKEITETTTVRVSYDTKYGVQSHKVISNVKEEHGQHFDVHEMQDKESHAEIATDGLESSIEPVRDARRHDFIHEANEERYSPIVGEEKYSSMEFIKKYGETNTRDRNGNLENFPDETRKVSVKDITAEFNEKMLLNNCGYNCNDACNDRSISCHSKFVEVTATTLANESRYGLPQPNLT